MDVLRPAKNWGKRKVNVLVVCSPHYEAFLSGLSLSVIISGRKTSKPILTGTVKEPIIIGSQGEDFSISLEDITGPAEDPDKLPNAITK